MTSKAFGHQPLLEAAAQAFDEPLINDDGSMICRWVKKQVTNREYNKHYAAVPAYRKLTEQNGLVTVAFFLPIHEADLDKVDYCEDSEVRKLQLTR
jgi:hypothetical protein